MGGQYSEVILKMAAEMPALANALAVAFGSFWRDGTNFEATAQHSEIILQFLLFGAVTQKQSSAFFEEENDQDIPDL